MFCCTVNLYYITSLPKFTFARLGLTKFQSHNGAIAAGSWTKLTNYGSRVSIPQGAIAAFRHQGHHMVVVVSIPQWCDCCSPTLPVIGARLDTQKRKRWVAISCPSIIWQAKPKPKPCPKVKARSGDERDTITCCPSSPMWTRWKGRYRMH